MIPLLKALITAQVHTWAPAGMPPHELKLKVGCVVMLLVLRNLHATRGLKAL